MTDIKFLDPEAIRSTHGYLYGWCARRMHYIQEAGGEHPRTKQEVQILENGKRKHTIYEWKLQQEYPQWKLLPEKEFTRMLPSPIYGFTKVRVTPDLAGPKVVVEIKPRYSMKAYIQTLVQKYVLPDRDFKIYQYVNREMFPIKADLSMAKVYLGRILTALKFLPPRIPKADMILNKTCNHCPFIKRCFEEEDSTWENFKEKSAYAIGVLQA